MRMESLQWSIDKEDPSSLLHVCTSFQPGVLDAYDKETKNILQDLKSILQRKEGTSSDIQNIDVTNMKFVSPHNSLGRGPSFGKKAKARSLSMENLVSTLMSRENFSDNYIQTLHMNARAQEELETKSEPNRSQTGRFSKLRKKPIKARVIKPDVLAPAVGVTGMADLKVTPPELGTLTISTQDPTIKKFKILPPIDGDQLSSCDSPEKVKPKAGDGPTKDMDFSDPWQISSTEKWNSDAEKTRSFYIVQNNKDNNMDATKKAILVKPKASKGKPMTGPSPIANQYKVANMAVKNQAPALPDENIVANSYLTMSMMTSGQSELKKHLKHRQQKRENEQREFQEESVTGRPVNAQTLYKINYGDVEVPTTDVEMFAILSVEKYNSPLSEEFTKGTNTTREMKKYIGDKMEEEGVRKDQDDNSASRDALKYKKFSESSGRIGPDEFSRTSESSVSPQTDSENKGGDMTHPPVPTSETKQDIKAGMKVGHLVTSDVSRPRRKTKFGTMYKCYDTTKPLLRARQTEIVPIVLKPLVSAAPLDEQGRQMSYSTLVPPKAVPSQDVPTPSKYFPTRGVIVDTPSDKGKRISVTLPTVICDDESCQDEEGSVGLQEQALSLEDDNRDQEEKEHNRQHLNPNKVMLGGTLVEGSVSSEEFPSHPGSRMSMGSGSITKSRNSSARFKSDSDNQTDPDSGTIQMVPKFKVTGASMKKAAPIQNLAYSNVNVNNSNNLQPATQADSMNVNSVSMECARRVAPPRIGVSIRKNTSCPSFNHDNLNSITTSTLSVGGEPFEARGSSAIRKNTSSDFSTPTAAPDSRQAFLRVGCSGLSAKGNRIGSQSETIIKSEEEQITNIALSKEYILVNKDQTQEIGRPSRQKKKDIS